MEEIFCDYFLKNKVLLFLNISSSSSSSITFILLNNSNIAYFWHNAFPNFYFDGLPLIPLKFCV